MGVTMEAKTLSKYLVACNAMESPERDTNGYKYKYAQLDQVKSIVKTGLLANKLDYYQHMTVNGGIQLLQLHLVDLESGDDCALDTRIIKQCDDPQDDGKTQTYFIRYQLLCAFNLCPEDTDAASVKYEKPKKKQEWSPQAKALANAVIEASKGSLDKRRLFDEVQHLSGMELIEHLNGLLNYYKDGE